MARLITPSRTGDTSRSTLGLLSAHVEGHQSVVHDNTPHVQGQPVWAASTGWYDGPVALTQFHVHYLDWVLALTSAEQHRWLHHWLDDHRQADSRTAWAPYVAACRVGTLLRVIAEVDTPLRERIEESLSIHDAVLRLRMERALGGNHLLHDQRARVAIAYYFDPNQVDDVALTFVDELERQILSDGVHHERSASYHAVVLADAIAVAEALDTANPLRTRLDVLIHRMDAALAALRHLDGTLPHFNDAPKLASAFDAQLAVRPSSPSALGASGFRSCTTRDLKMLADLGAPGPAHLPGHAHAQIGSFEVSTSTQVLIRNLGTSTYQPGPRRSMERSTAGHTAVVVDEKSQSDLWSGFRFGRIPSVETRAIDSGWVVSHDGFGSDVIAERTIRTIGERMTICDVVESTSSTRATISLFTETKPTIEQCIVAIGPLRLSVDSATISVQTCDLAAAMHETTPGWHVTLDLGTARRLENTIELWLEPSDGNERAGEEEAR